MNRTLLEYFPPNGGASIQMTTGDAAEYRLISMDGISPITVDPQTIKSPGQFGETAVDVIVAPRVVNVQLILQADDSAALWDLRSRLAAAVAFQPVRYGETIAMGLLRLTLDGRPPLELEVVPRSAALPRPKGLGSLAVADLEFLAPNPYWREIADTRIDLSTASGGFQFGVQFPLTMTSNNVLMDVTNHGDVDASPFFRIYGDCTTSRLRNLTTGKVLEISGEINAGEYVEVQTAFGSKSITLYSGGVATNIMSRINLAKADFWPLVPGYNQVKFEADVNVSGRAEMYWRERYAGV